MMIFVKSNALESLRTTSQAEIDNSFYNLNSHVYLPFMIAYLCSESKSDVNDNYSRSSSTFHTLNLLRRSFYNIVTHEWYIMHLFWSSECSSKITPPPPAPHNFETFSL